VVDFLVVCFLRIGGGREIVEPGSGEFEDRGREGFGWVVIGCGIFFILISLSYI